jgi:SagB-type dehydrogenase family enzyme
MPPAFGRYAVLFMAVLTARHDHDRDPWRGKPMQQAAETTIALPAPKDRAGITLTRALETRRSVRDFAPRQLSQLEVSRLLWAAQGVTHPAGLRTAPSAGALDPLEVYLSTADGLFHYRPRDHRLARVRTADLRATIQRAAHGQEAVGNAPAVFVIAAVYRRTAVKYGPDRGVRYVHIEVGHAAQNLLLEATALGLGSVPVGAFDDAELASVLDLPAGHEPVYLIPVGQPRR